MSEIQWQDYYNKYFYVRNITTRECVGAQNKYTDCQFVAKIHRADPNGKMQYVDSVIIPTDYYPLDNTNSFNVFHHGNCKQVTDADVISCFDSVKLRCGYCYTMADELHAALNHKSINNSIWCGWLFVSGTIPIHHCWVTVGENNESVLDVQENFEAETQEIKSKLLNEGKQLSYENFQKLRVEFAAKAMRGKVKNSDRCSTQNSPLGVPSPSAFYVGTKVSSGNAARQTYNNLIDRYPNHIVESNLGTDRMNETQRKLYKSFRNGK